MWPLSKNAFAAVVVLTLWCEIDSTQTTLFVSYLIRTTCKSAVISHIQVVYSNISAWSITTCRPAKTTSVNNEYPQQRVTSSSDTYFIAVRACILKVCWMANDVHEWSSCAVWNVRHEISVLVIGFRLRTIKIDEKCRVKQFCWLLGKPTVNRWCYLLVREMRWAVKIRVPTLKIIPTIITTGFSITTSLAPVATGADAGASYSSVRCGSSAMMMRLLPVSYGSTPLLVTTARPHRTTRPANVCFTPSCLMA